MSDTTGPRADVADEELLARLIADAKTAAAYAQRAGLLANNSLPLAIAAVDRLKSKSWAAPEVAALQAALNETMRSISPTTIQDLKGPSAPFTRSVALSVQAGVFFVISGVLIVMTAFFTLSFNYGSSLIVELQALQQANTQQRISELVRDIVSDAKPLQLAPSNEINYEASNSYLQKIEEIRGLDQRVSMYSDYANSFIAANISLVSFSLMPASTLSPARAGPPIMAPPKPDDQVVTAETPPDPVSDGAAADIAIAATVPVTPPPYGDSIYDICSDDSRKSLETGYTRPELGTTAMAGIIRFHAVEGLSLTCMLRLKFHLDDFPELEKHIFELRRIINTYGLWVLPALYGALGGITYYMRRMLNPNLPNPTPLRIISRTLIAALAGIIIAWFWSPSPESGSIFKNIGINLFAAAFLFGYGIDIFFSLLDQLVTMATGGIRKMGTSET